MSATDTSSAPTTSQLLSTAGEGDQDAWLQLVHRFEPAVTATVRGYRLQEADARDACQRTWLRMLEHHRRLREPEALGGWLTTTASRECLRIMRDRARVDPVGPAVETPRADPTTDLAEQVIDAETARRARELIGLLPWRSALLLTALFADNPPPYAELSRRTGIPVGSIGPTRARALRRLRSLIEGSVPDRFDRGPSAV